MPASRIADNLAAVRHRIATASPCREVRLVCVTKYARDRWVRALLQAGADELGESRPEAFPRLEELRAEGHSFVAHLIGPLQSRKAPLAARFDWFQALDRPEIALKLVRRRADMSTAEPDATMLPPLDVLIQVNIGGEPQKHGVAFVDVESLVAQLVNSGALASTLRLRGLMCIPPGPATYASPAVYERGTRTCFRQMRALSDRIAASYTELPFDTLSMGMSQDYHWAVEEGSSLVRVGSALFTGLEG